MGTNCAPLVVDLFLFCYERDFMMSLSDDKMAYVIDAFNTTSRYLDNFLKINNVYFGNIVKSNIPSELQLNKAYTPDTEAAVYPPSKLLQEHCYIPYIPRKPYSPKTKYSPISSSDFSMS